MMGSGGCGGPIYRGILAVKLTAGIRTRNGLASSIVPAGTSFHRSAEFSFLLSLLCTTRCETRHDERHKCALTARVTCLLGRAERSSPKAAQRRAAGAGLDGEGAHRANIRAAAMRTTIGRSQSCRRRFFSAPAKLGSIHPHAMHDDRQSSRHSDDSGMGE